MKLSKESSLIFRKPYCFQKNCLDIYRVLFLSLVQISKTLFSTFFKIAIISWILLSHFLLSMTDIKYFVDAYFCLFLKMLTRLHKDTGKKKQYKKHDSSYKIDLLSLNIPWWACKTSLQSKRFIFLCAAVSLLYHNNSFHCFSFYISFIPQHCA